MRILSQSEVKLLKLQPRTLPDETTKWFFVSGVLPVHHRYEDVRDAENRCRDLVEDCLRGEHCRTEMRDRPSFDAKFEHKEVEEAVVLFQLTTDLLLFPKQIEKLGLSPAPGYLYLALPPFKFRSRHMTNPFVKDRKRAELKHSVQDNGDILYELDFRPRPELEQLETLLNARELEIPGSEAQYLPPTRQWAALPFQRQGGKRTVSRAPGGMETQIHQDLEEATCSHPLRVFETPFEFPPGFVRETAMLLANEFRADCPDFVRTFKDLAFRPGETPSPRAAKRNVKKGALPGKFPSGEPQLDGPDAFWRYCAHPSWIEAILLARLIGGESWNYVLGNLEARYGQNMDWDANVGLSLKTA